jgi:hypothetical protein
MMYEDEKISKRNIYTTYSDCKGAFGRMNHRILFQLMKEYGFQDSYIAACKQLYTVSNIYYMTTHGKLPPFPYIEAPSKETRYPPFSSKSAWNPSSDGLPSAAEATNPHINLTNIPPQSSHMTTTAMQTT